MPRLDESGYLQNASFVTKTYRPRARRRTDNSWKYPLVIGNRFKKPDFDVDAKSRGIEVFTFFWANETERIITEKTGNFYASSKGIILNLSAQTVGWDREFNQVTLGVVEGSLSAEVIAHELGHANLTYANPKFPSHSSIGGIACDSIRGCAIGIDEGQADYQMALVFEEDPSFGHLFDNEVEGTMAGCGLSRDPSKNSKVTIFDIAKACPDPKVDIYVVGSLYASMWWEIRKHAQPNQHAIDRLFSEHLRVIDASDDFLTAFRKVAEIDQRLFSGLYSDLFKNELRRRGFK